MTTISEVEEGTQWWTSGNKKLGIRKSGHLKAWDCRSAWDLIPHLPLSSYRTLASVSLTHTLTHTHTHTQEV